MPSKRPEKDTPRSTPPPLGVYPVSLRPGDILIDEITEWRVTGHPYMSAGGMIVNVRVESVKPSGVIQIQVRAWGAHERVAVKRG